MADFTFPFALSRCALFLKTPGNSHSFVTYFDPFTLSSWSVIVTFVLILPIAIFFVDYCPAPVTAFTKVGLLKSYTTVVLNSLGMGSDYDPQKISSRIVLLR